jgi:predicted O-linked N-acetylglucosamine transferase (SPINDLY family)
VEALNNRGAAFMALKRHALALQNYDSLLAIDSANAGAWNNRGCALKELHRHDEARVCFEKAVALKPDFVESLINHGSVLATLGQYELAAAAYQSALAQRPGLAYAPGNLILYRLHACDWSHLEEERVFIAAALRAGQRVIDPFVALMLSASPAEQLQAARIWVANEALSSSAPLWRGERYSHDKIRIAYVSNIFHAHATAVLIAGVFEHHDRNRFETTAVSFAADDQSDLRTRTRSSFDRFIDVRGMSDVEIATLLRQMEIDIAVDLTGYTRDHRSGIFAHRPAAIQANYLGYPGTMGAPYFDYIIADRLVIPDEDRPFYAEHVVHLPDTYQSNDALRVIAATTPSRADVELPTTGFVFCSFNNTNKIRPETFEIWMRLLREIQDSVLWLLDYNDAATRNLKREAAARSVAPERLIFAPRMDLAQHLARHRLADLFLDTLPYGAHTTASDALWAGVPVLTCLGTSFAGRVGASLLTAIGLPELVTKSPSEYEALALKLARDRTALSHIKAKLDRQRTIAPLFDTARFTRNLESAYSTMWERQQRGELPTSFAVEAVGGASPP